MKATPPKTRFTARADATTYAKKADRVVICHPDGGVVAVIEIVSPGNKNSRDAIRAFARKSIAFLENGIQVLIVDLFPPSRRDPQGIHKVIWDRIKDEPFELPSDKPLSLVSYCSASKFVAHIQPVAVGDSLPEMPIYLTSSEYVPCPLEETYQTSWEQFPAPLKRRLL